MFHNLLIMTESCDFSFVFVSHFLEGGGQTNKVHTMVGDLACLIAACLILKEKNTVHV